MAGSFGFESDKYDVSIAIGERRLLPNVRRAANSTLIVADGFSCREMIRQETDRHAVHFAQVLQMAIREGPNGPSGHLPEKQYTTLPRTPAVPVGIIASAAIVAGIGLLWSARRRDKAERQLHASR